MLPSLHVPGQPKGIATARRKNLPPDGLLCNYRYDKKRSFNNSLFNTCNFSLHLCHGQRLKGYEYCIRHILEDKSAPYRPCAYSLETSHTSRQCPRAAPRSSRGEGYCREHSRAVVTASRRIVRKRGGGAVTALQDSLDQYKRGRLAEAGEGRLGQLVLGGERVGQQDSEESEVIRVGDTWTGDDGDSDCESVDSEAEEPLKHAGVFTGEEVMRTMRDKLIRFVNIEYSEEFICKM